MSLLRLNIELLQWWLHKLKKKLITSNKNTKKTIYIVGTNGLPVRYGGWDMLLHHFTLALSEDYDIYVYTSSFEALKGIKKHNGAFVRLVPLKANGLQSIIYDFVTMLDASIRGADHILVLGVSGGIFFPVFKIFRSSVILNPDGAEWKRSKFRGFIKIFLKGSEQIGITFADKVITDSAVICEDVLNDYGIRSAVIEYGGDHSFSTVLGKETAARYSITQNTYAFKVCRIVPENNIRMILDAFSKTDYRLLLIGNWSNSKFGIDIRAEYSRYNNLSLLDPIYDQKALDELRSNCKLYIHGHSVGGTNPSLVEAMNLGLPCLVYDVNYNRETTEDSAEYFSTESELSEALYLLWDDKGRLDSIGNGLQMVAKRRYRWKDIIAKYRAVIEKSL